MKPRITLIALLFFPLCAVSPAFAQAILDDVRRDILKESQEEIKSVNEELERHKKKYIEKEETKKKEYEDKILKAQKLLSIEQQNKVIGESQDLLDTIQEKTEFKSEKRWRYEELLKIYAEKPIEEMPVEQQEQAVNERLATATTELIDLLKRKAVEEAKRKRGEAYAEVETDEYLLVQLRQYTQLVERIKSSQVAQGDKIVSKKETVVQSTEELIEALKKEALRRAELKALAIKKEEELQVKKINGIFGLHYGYDTNINADPQFEGGQFVRNYFALDWLPSLNRYLKGDLGAWYLADNYTEDQDVTFRIAAGKASVNVQPFGDDNLVLEPGFEWADTHYPNNASLSTKENKLFLNTTHKFLGNWSQNLNYEGAKISNNQNRLARDGSGTDKPETPLVKLTHSIEHILNFPALKGTYFKLRQRGRKQISNDAFTDFYDYYSYQVTGEIGRSLSQKLYAKASLAYEKTDYTFRTVSAHQIAQEDNAYTQKVTLFYFLTDDWMLNYTWTRSKVDSNDPIYDYEKMSHLFGVYYSF